LLSVRISINIIISRQLLLWLLLNLYVLLLQRSRRPRLFCSARFQSLPASVSHALIKGWPTLPTFVLLFVPLPLAIDPLGGVPGPFFLRHLPLRLCPVFDLRRYDRARRHCSGRRRCWLCCRRRYRGLRSDRTGQNRGQQCRLQAGPGSKHGYIFPWDRHFRMCVAFRKKIVKFDKPAPAALCALALAQAENTNRSCIERHERQYPETRTGLLVRVSGCLRRPCRTRRPCSA